MINFRSKHCKETDDIFTIISSAIERETKAMERLVDEVRGGVEAATLAHRMRPWQLPALRLKF
jgi:hypothetical protein